MRKVHLKIFFGMVVLTSIIFGCNQNPFVGIGNEVDVTPPNLSVTSHRSGQWVYKNFILSGVVTDNIGVSGVNIRLIERDKVGNESVIKNWKATVSGGTWKYTFELDRDFGKDNSGQKTLDIAAYDKRNNFTSVRTLIGITNKESAPTLTKPREEILELVGSKGGPEYYASEEFKLDDFNLLEYFNNGIVTIKGYSKTQYAPDKAITVKLFRSDDLSNDVYSSTITDGEVLPLGASGNTSNFEFAIDTIEEEIQDGVYLIELVVEEATGMILSIPKGYIYIDQSTDKPKVFITSPGTETFPESVAGGTAFDDDGLKELYYIIYRENQSVTTDYRQWEAFETAHGDNGYNVKYGMINLSDAKPLQYPWVVKPTPKGVGNYIVNAVAIDINDVTSDCSSFTFKQFTTDIPEVTITKPESTMTYGINVPFTIKAKSGNSDYHVTKIYYDLSSDINPSDIDLTSDISPTKTNFHILTGGTDYPLSDNVSVSGFIDATSFINEFVHDIRMRVFVENTDNIRSQVKVTYIKADNYLPEIAITSPPNNQTGLNGNWEIVGTANDDWSGVEALYYGYFYVAPDMVVNFNTKAKIEAKADIDLANINLTTKNWHKIPFTQPSWTYLFDTTKVGDGDYDLYIAAVDKVGKVNWTTRKYNIDQEADRPNVNITTPEDNQNVTPNTIISGEANDDDGLKYIYVYIVKSGQPTFDVPPDDYRTWGNLKTGDVSGDIIDLTSNTPRSYPWNVKAPNQSGTYRVYIMAVDKNTPNSHDSDPDGYYSIAERDDAKNSMKLYTVRNFVQKTSDAPITEIKNSVSDIYSGEGNFDLELKFTGGGTNEVTRYWYKRTSDIVGKTDVAFIEVDVVDNTVIKETQIFDASSYFNASVKELKIEVKCEDSTNSESNTAVYYLRADSRSPQITVTTPSGAPRVDVWLAAPDLGKISGTIIDDVLVKRVTIKYVEDDTTWDSDVTADGLNLVAGTTTTSRAFTKTFAISDIGNNYGEKNFVITAYDAMGNTSVSNVRLAKETEIPVIGVLTAPADGKLGTATTFTLSGTVTDNIAPTKVEIYLSGNPVALASLTAGSGMTVTGTSATWTKTFNVLSDLTDYSDKTFEIKAYDEQGNNAVRNFNISGDKLKPVISGVLPANNGSIGTGASFTITGKITDDVILKSISIKHVEGPTTWTSNVVNCAGTGGISFTQITANKDYNFSKTFTIADIGGYTDKTFEITVLDSQNNEFVSSLRLKGDSTAPVISNILPINNSKITNGANLVLTGKITDDVILKSISIKHVEGPTTWTSNVANGVGTDGISFTQITANKDYNFSKTFVIADIGGYTDKTFEITVTDIMDNKSYATVRIVGDGELPVIGVLTAPADGKLGTATTFTLSGTVTDNIAPTKVEIYLSGNPVALASLTPGSGMTVTGTSATWTKIFNVITDLTDYSDKTFEIKAYDGQNNSTVRNFNISGDKVKPVISGVLPANNGSIGTGASFTITGKITDDVILKSISIKHVEGPTTWTSNVVNGAGTGGISFTQITANKDYNFSKTFTIADIGGYTDKTFEITVLDIQNNEFVTSLRLKGDSTAPVIADLTLPNDGKIGVNNTFTLSGTVTDNVKPTKVEIYLSGNPVALASLEHGTGMTVTGTSGIWTKIFNIMTDLGGYSDKTFEIKAYDGQNNISSRVFNIAGDSTAPGISVTSHSNNATLGTSASLLLQGNVSDDTRIVHLKIHWVEGNKNWESDVTGVADGLSFVQVTENKSYNWAKTFNLAADLFAGQTPMPKSPYTDKTFDITATDSVGKEKVMSLRLTGDTTIPNVSITSHSSGDNIGINPTFILSGTASDNIEVSRVTIKEDGQATVWDSDSAQVTLGAGPTPRTWSKTFTIATELGGWSNKAFEVTAYDQNDNIRVVRLNLSGDAANPSVSITSPAANATGLNVFTTVEGVASDDYAGVKAVYYGYFSAEPNMADYDTEAKIEAKADSVLANINKTTKVWHKVTPVLATWSYNYDTRIITSGVQANYKLFTAVVDNVGKVGYVSRTINIDQSKDIPTSDMSIPVANQQLIPGSNISASSSDDDGVARVFYSIQKTAIPNPGVPNITTGWGTIDTADQKAGVINAGNAKNFYFSNITTPSGEGEYIIYISAVDMFGVLQATSFTRTYKQYATTLPTVQITNNDLTEVKKGLITVNLNVSGGGINTVKQIDYTIESTKYGPITGTLTTANFGAGHETLSTTVSFDSSLYTSGTVHDIAFTVRTTNSEDKTTLQDVTAYFRADNTAPSVNIVSPSAGANINGAQRIQVNTGDDYSGIDVLYIGYFDMTHQPTLSASTTKTAIETQSVTGTPVLNKWFKISNPNPVEYHTYQTIVLASGATDKIENFPIWVIGFDKAIHTDGGNPGYSSPTFNLDQDMDRPKSTITQPKYTQGSHPATPVDRNDGMPLVPQDFIIMGEAEDDDGIEFVQVKIEQITNGGASVTIQDWINAAGTVVWTYKMTGYAVSSPTNFYKLSTKIKDINGRIENGSITYFVVSNEAPIVDIISPSIYDPDGYDAKAYADIYGTIISNKKDDVWWDGNSDNNHIYYDDDSVKKTYGWDNDLSEASLHIFNKTPTDSNRANYYRFVVRAKDNGQIDRVDISLDGGVNYIEETLKWSNFSSATGTFVSSNPALYDVAKSTASPTTYSDYVMGDGYVWFYFNVDTTLMSSSSIVKVSVYDNNTEGGGSLNGIASVQVNIDNSAPTASMTMWGHNATTPKYQSSKARKFLGGNYGDAGGAGVRYVNMYVWNNQEPNPDSTPNYNGGSGATSVTVDSGFHSITLPESLGSVSSSTGSLIQHANTTNNYPNYWMRALRTETDRWQIQDIYSWNSSLQDVESTLGTYKGVESKYAVSLSDGKKLIALEVVDKAGNKTQTYYEQIFAEYPPQIGASTSVDWTPLANTAKTAFIGSEPTIYIGRTFNFKVYATDSGPNSGINRVRVYLRKGTTYTLAYGSDVGGLILGNPLDGVIQNAGGYYNLASAVDITGLSGAYSMEIEVRDNDGAIDMITQQIFIDNAAPVINFIAPADGQSVIGQATISGTVTDVDDQIKDNAIDLQVYNDATNESSWSPTALAAGSFSRVWNVSSTPSFTKVEIAATDRAMNKAVSSRTVLLDSQPPQITTLAITGSTTITNSTFINLYNESAGGFLPNILGGVRVINSNMNIASGSLVVTDLSAQDVSENITSAQWRVIGNEQATAYSGATVYKALVDLTPSSDNTSPYSVGGSAAYNATLNEGEYGLRVKIIQGGTKELEIDSTASGTSSYFIVDKTAPHVWIENMTNADFKGYGTTTAYGHIDTGLNSNGSDTGYDDVSGIFYLDIGVFDNYLINTVNARLPGGANVVIAQRNASGVMVLNNSGLAVTDRSYWSASYKPADSVDTAGGTEVLRKNKNWMKIRLEINSARITNVAQLAQNIRISATDAAGNASATATPSSEYSAGDETNPTGFNYANMVNDSILNVAGISAYQQVADKYVDVVPYISKIETTITGGLKTLNLRSSSGEYNIRTGNVNNFITVNGFNLNPITNGVRITTSTYKSGLNGTTLIGNALAFNEPNASFTSLTLSNNSIRSGYLGLVSGTVGSPVAAINNINDNSHITNQEWDDLYQMNRIRNDDRFIKFFNITNTNINSATYPNMIMDGNTPHWGYIQSGAANDMMLRRGVSNGSNTAMIRVLAGDQVAMTKDAGGRYHMVSVNSFTQGRLYYLNHEFTTLHFNNGYTTPYWSNHVYNNSTCSDYDGNNVIQMEDVNYAPGLKLGRYVRPVIRSTGNSTSTHAKLFLLYYDNNANELVYRNWQVGQNGNVTNQNYTLYGNYRSNLANNNTTGRQVISSTASEHFNMAVTSAGVVVIAYYDQVNSQMYIQYSTTTSGGTTALALTAASPTTTVNWSAPIAIPRAYVGWYPSITIDSAGRLHIAAYNTANASLSYIFMNKFDDVGETPTVVTVDSFNSVGYYNEIQIGPDNKPWIAYYNISETGTRDAVKLARYNGTAGTATPGVNPTTGYVTGDWEVSTIPVGTVPNGSSASFLKVNLGFTTTNIPTIGYAGVGLEYSQPVTVIE